MESPADDVTWCNSKSYSRHCILPEVNTFILLPHTPQEFQTSKPKKEDGMMTHHRVMFPIVNMFPANQVARHVFEQVCTIRCTWLMVRNGAFQTSQKLLLLHILRIHTGMTMVVWAHQAPWSNCSHCCCFCHCCYCCCCCCYWCCCYCLHQSLCALDMVKFATAFKCTLHHFILQYSKCLALETPHLL